MTEDSLSGHSGELAVAVARAHGVETMFTLSGAHVFPMYDGAVKAEPPMRLLDVRHEQTAAFAAEATGKLTRVPGLAVLTAGPGVTNGLSAVAQAQFAGSPMVVVGGRAPAARWGSGSLQEIDQPPILAPITKQARTLHTADDVLEGVHEAFVAAGSPHRGPTFVDIPLDEFFNNASGPLPTGTRNRGGEPDGDAITEIAELLAAASRPVLILGTDVWADGAEEAALRFVESAGIPTITNGMGRGLVPGGHPLLVTKARGQALSGSDLVIVVGTPLDFRLGYGVFGGDDDTSPARVVHVADSPGQVSGHAELAASVAGDLTSVLDGHAHRPGAGRPATRLVRLGDRPAGRASRRRPRRTPPSWPRRPTPSTRPASTASSSPASPRTPWSSATAATSSASPASSSSPAGPAGGSTPGRTAAWAPGSDPPSRPGSPGRPPRSCCCWVTGPRGSP